MLNNAVIRRPVDCDVHHIWYQGICDATRERHYNVLEILLRDTPIEPPEWEMMQLIAWRCNRVPLHGGLKKLLPFVKVVPRRLANRDDFIKLYNAC